MILSMSKQYMALDIDLEVNKMRSRKKVKIQKSRASKKKMKLSTQLIIYYFSTTVIFLLLIGFLVIQSINNYGIQAVENQLIDQSKSSLDHIKQIIYLQQEVSQNMNVEMADKITQELSAGNREIRIYDNNSNLLSASIDGIKQSLFETEIFENHLRDALEGNYAYFSDGKLIYFASPIEINSQFIGILEIVYPLDLLNSILSNTTYILILAGVAYGIFIILLSIYLARVTVNPIKKLMTVADRYSNQDFVPIQIKGPYEIEKLTDSISAMGQKVQEYINRQNQFVSNVSHELRTPLTAIKGYSEFLIDEVKGNKDLERAVFHLNNESKRLTKLVNELLTLSRFNADDEKYLMETINISELLYEVLESLRIRIDDEDVIVSKDIAEDIRIMGDSEKLIQVILNIVDNAIKYSKEDKRVEISLKKIKDDAVLEVKDRGIGIDPSEIDKIFHRFYRARNTKAYKGTGLGLAISKEIIKAHNGSIEVESEIAKGTRVTITLPVTKELLQD